MVHDKLSVCSALFMNFIVNNITSLIQARLQIFLTQVSLERQMRLSRGLSRLDNYIYPVNHSSFRHGVYRYGPGKNPACQATAARPGYFEKGELKCSAIVHLVLMFCEQLTVRLTEGNAMEVHALPRSKAL
ncbi:unnamed protein product [Protopolystoma xenopodis]|uniref:Uncharacterized protein n=1 Tax=Protopolystoma xenopodis TaxID=117903 RepID=A0A3S4ZTU6_9PLAT|nr:unnamed protein product [Protopolystoma xenopodis]